MGGGHSRRRGPPPKTDILIPDFPYPPEILSYIISQSTDLNITFTPVGSTTPVVLEIPPNPTAPVPSSTASTWVDTEIPYFFDLNEVDDTSPTEASTSGDVPINNNRKKKTPSKTTIPAFSDPTAAPTESSANVQKYDFINGWDKFSYSNKMTLTKEQLKELNRVLYEKRPPMWQAAIDAMEFTGGLNLPITTREQMYTLYDNLQHKIMALMGYGPGPQYKMAALIYFCTVIKVAFESFNQTLAYNYLNGKFPKVFSDAKAYNNFCMINSYATYASVIFNKNPNLDQYMDINNRLVTYFIPPILSSALAVLQKGMS